MVALWDALTMNSTHNVHGNVNTYKYVACRNVHRITILVDQVTLNVFCKLQIYKFALSALLKVNIQKSYIISIFRIVVNLLDLYQKLQCISVQVTLFYTFFLVLSVKLNRRKHYCFVHTCVILFYLTFCAKQKVIVHVLNCKLVFEWRKELNLMYKYFKNL